MLYHIDFIFFYSTTPILKSVYLLLILTLLNMMLL